MMVFFPNFSSLCENRVTYIYIYILSLYTLGVGGCHNLKWSTPVSEKVELRERRLMTRRLG